MLTGEAYKRVGDRVASALLQNQPHIVAEIVETMLAQHPDDRFSSMKEVARACYELSGSGKACCSISEVTATRCSPTSVSGKRS
jgi:hypothetical protein